MVLERAKPGAVDASFKWHRYSPKRTEPPKALIDRHHASRDQKNNAVISLERTHNGPKRWTSGAEIQNFFLEYLIGIMKEYSTSILIKIKRIRGSHET